MSEYWKLIDLSKVTCVFGKWPVTRRMKLGYISILDTHGIDMRRYDLMGAQVRGQSGHCDNLFSLGEVDQLAVLRICAHSRVVVTSGTQDLIDRQAPNLGLLRSAQQHLHVALAQCHVHRQSRDLNDARESHLPRQQKHECFEQQRKGRELAGLGLAYLPYQAVRQLTRRPHTSSLNSCWKKFPRWVHRRSPGRLARQCEEPDLAGRGLWTTFPLLTEPLIRISTEAILFMGAYSTFSRQKREYSGRILVSGTGRYNLGRWRFPQSDAGSFMSVGKNLVMKFMALAAIIAIALSGPASVGQASMGRVLLVASSVNSMTLKDGRRIPTGYFLNELAVPAQAFQRAGYEVIVATPDGNAPAVDPISLTPDLFHGDTAAYTQALKFVLSDPSIQKPEKLDTVVKGNLASFVAIYVPGGRAPMVDLMENKALGTALMYFHKSGKTTAMLCHAPVASTAAVQDPKAFRQAMAEGNVAKAKSLAAGWPYAGYKMTLLSTAEEMPKEQALGGKMPFYIEDAVRIAGAEVQVGPPAQPLVVVDREMITGQNPASDHALSDAVLASLKGKTAD